MLKIFGNWWKGIKGVQLCACSHFSGYATNLFTCRLTYLAPFARAQFLVSFFLLLLSFSQFASSSTCLIGFRPNLVRMTSGWVATKVMLCLTSKVMSGSQGSKRSFLRKMHLLLHALMDFDETWSEASVGKWLQKLCFVWPQRSCRGHRGQKSNLFFKMLRLSWNFKTMILMTFLAS